jgi:NRAMP (natural resistance-associated macrophage protein)-like metal ion transporter
MPSRTPSRASSHPKTRGLWSWTSKRVMRDLGPGLITGAADDDPSGIATYSQAGAQFGYQLGWTVVLTYPLMVGIQLVSARMGRVTGRGLAANIKAAFPAPILHAAVILLLVANVLNIAADVAAMGEVAELVTGLDRHAMTTVFVVATVLLQVFVPYHRYVSFL